jgi:hypothetical protein
MLHADHKPQHGRVQQKKLRYSKYRILINGKIRPQHPHGHVGDGYDHFSTAMGNIVLHRKTPLLIFLLRFIITGLEKYSKLS